MGRSLLCVRFSLFQVRPLADSPRCANSNSNMGTDRTEFRNTLQTLDLSDRPEEASCRQRMLDLLDTRSDCFRRDAFPAHFTGSALVVAADGKATLPVLAPRLGVKDVTGHSIMIHEGGDNYSDQPKPLGGGGARIACGVIQ